MTPQELTARLADNPDIAIEGEWTAATGTAVSIPSDSDKENATRLLLNHLKLMGLPTPVQEYRFSPYRRWRADLAWPELKLLVEIHGGVWTNGRHTRGKGFTEDRHKMNAAVILGYRVLEFTTGMVEDETAVSMINLAIEGVGT